MPQFCATCGAQMTEGSIACPACGKANAQSTGGGAAAAPAASSSTAGGLDTNVASALAYFFIPAIAFLVMEPYNKNKTVRFHSFQSIFLSLGLFVTHIVLGLIPILGWIASLLIFLGSVILWVVLLIKTFQGQKMSLPVIGPMAEEQANKM